MVLGGSIDAWANACVPFVSTETDEQILTRLRNSRNKPLATLATLASLRTPAGMSRFSMAARAASAIRVRPTSSNAQEPTAEPGELSHPDRGLSERFGKLATARYLPERLGQNRPPRASW